MRMRRAGYHNIEAGLVVDNWTPQSILRTSDYMSGKTPHIAKRRAHTREAFAQLVDQGLALGVANLLVPLLEVVGLEALPR